MQCFLFKFCKATFYAIYFLSKTWLKIIRGQKMLFSHFLPFCHNEAASHKTFLEIYTHTIEWIAWKNRVLKVERGRTGLGLTGKIKSCSFTQWIVLDIDLPGPNSRVSCVKALCVQCVSVFSPSISLLQQKMLCTCHNLEKHWYTVLIIMLKY